MDERSKKWEALAEELRQRTAGSTPGAEIRVELADRGHELKEGILEYAEGEYNGINVYPENGDAIHHLEDVVEFSQYHRLCAYVTIDHETSKPFIHIF